MELAIETNALRKTYRSMKGTSVAVDGLTMSVPAHGVHGFLGPNGSGKTTTIRMLLGLIRADSGTAKVFGHEVPAQLPLVIGRVGAIVESPKFFPQFSAERSLKLLAGAIGAPDTRVHEVLNQVGLSQRAGDAFGSYSLGMKQRVAIAATLLKNPDLLIFDEPTNGLDPAGIRDVRDTMRSLGEQGRTVLVSSHILAEGQQVADTVSIIARGRLLASGRVADIMGGGGQPTYRVGVEAVDDAGRALYNAGMQVTRAEHGLTVSGAMDPAQITKTLADEGIYLRELAAITPDLEAAFLQLTAGAGLHHSAMGYMPPPGGGAYPAAPPPMGQPYAGPYGGPVPQGAPPPAGPPPGSPPPAAPQDPNRWSQP